MSNGSGNQSKRQKLDDPLRKENINRLKPRRVYKFQSNIPTNNLTIGNTAIESKKAVSVNELKQTAANVNILGLRDPNVISKSASTEDAESSPIRHSSQDFNLEITPLKDSLNSNSKQFTRSSERKLRPSSDDGIFWLNTPVHKHPYNGDHKSGLPSSPLREKTAGSQNTYDSTNSNEPNGNIKINKDSNNNHKITENILDPNLQQLLEKYNNINQTLNKSPTLNRSLSDTHTLNKHSEDYSFAAPIIATKNSLNESILQTMSKLKPKQPNHSHPLPDYNTRESSTEIKKDVSQMLLQIGSTLVKTMESLESSIDGVPDVILDNHSEAEVNIMNLDDLKKDTPLLCTQTRKGKEVNLKVDIRSEDEEEDIFSDDIDLEELEFKATQIRQLRDTQLQNKQTLIINNEAANLRSENLNSSPVKKHKTMIIKSNNVNASPVDDFFSDDGDEIMELVEFRRTQNPANVLSKNIESKDSDDSFDSDVDNDLLKNLEPKEKKDNEREKSISKFKDIKLTQEIQQLNIFDDNVNLAKSSIVYETCHRLQIKSMIKNKFKKSDKVIEQLILKCQTPEDTMINIVVRDQWLSLDFKENDVIHIIADTKESNYKLVDNTNNLLIWNPDILLSATRIADAVDCKRRAIIHQKFTAPGITSMPLVLGNIVHSLFQACLSNRNVSEEFAEEFIDDQISLYLINILSLDKTKSEMKDIIWEHFEYIKDWFDTFVPLPTSTQPGSNFKKRTDFKATNILEVEEDIISPVFGLRGLIDVVIEARLKNGTKVVTPLEIKTGREYIGNRAQVALYTTLIKQRYDVNSNYISLVYTKMKVCYFEALRSNDFRALVNIRNELTKFLIYDMTDLPEIKRAFSCERCFELESCMSLNKLVENGNAKDSGIDEVLFNSLTDHIDKPIYREYYNHWNSLITKEEGLMNAVKKNLWLHSSKYREENGGKCVGMLSVTDVKFLESKSKYIYTFERDVNKYPLITLTQLAKYDRVILSDENGNFGLARGFIEQIRNDSIVISSDRKWTNSAVRLDDFNPETNQVFKSVLRNKFSTQRAETGSQSSINYGSQSIASSVSNKKYRIDKDDMYYGMSMARFNILNLFLPHGDFKRRELIVELRAPKYSNCPLINYSADESKFNEDQLRAFDIVSRTEDYSLILGMPGTGKTTVISNIIKFLVSNGKTVLVSSYTHSAVDNICEKLIKNMPASVPDNDKPLSLLRLGNSSNIREIVQPYALYSNKFHKNIKDKAEFDEVIHLTRIVATTCLGITDEILSRRQSFDYCIIDEASQVSSPICLGPISFADKFILVGDHYQLPPLVLNPDARQKGLDKSLFKILCDAHPESLIELTHQYRMCSDIMTVSNELIYNGRLKCGSEMIANQSLNIPYPERLVEITKIKNGWLSEIFQEDRKVIFVNEDMVPCKEISVGDKIENPTEAKLIITLIRSLLFCGISQHDVGVMSFYKGQLRHFYKGLKDFKDIEILTADRFQGRDKEIVIISLVRSDVMGDLLKEWRRVNVAMTRAKKKLIIFGSKKIMQDVKQFEGFVELFKSKEWFLELPENADKMYTGIFEFQDHFGTNFSEDKFPSSNLSSYSNPDLNTKQNRLVEKTHILKNVVESMNDVS